MAFKSLLNKMGLVEEDTPVAKPKTVQTPQVAATVQTTQAVPSTYTTAYMPMSSYSTPAADPAILDMLNQSLQENKLSDIPIPEFRRNRYRERQ